jgi:hypothetical protein
MFVVFTAGAALVAWFNRRKVKRLGDQDVITDYRGLQEARLAYDRALTALVVLSFITVIAFAFLLVRASITGTPLTPLELQRFFDEGFGE